VGKEFNDKGLNVYQCEICELGYAELKTAEQCEEYCNAHGSCSLEITRKAIYRPPVYLEP